MAWSYALCRFELLKGIMVDPTLRPCRPRRGETVTQGSPRACPRSCRSARSRRLLRRDTRGSRVECWRSRIARCRTLSPWRSLAVVLPALYRVLQIARRGGMAGSPDIPPGAATRIITSECALRNLYTSTSGSGGWSGSAPVAPSGLVRPERYRCAPTVLGSNSRTRRITRRVSSVIRSTATRCSTSRPSSMPRSWTSAKSAASGLFS